MDAREKRFVVSLGGSLIVPEEIDTSFLTLFKKVIDDLVSEGFLFLIIPGGGATARRYQEALRTLRVSDPVLLDSAGVSGVAANARLLQGLFKVDTIFWDNYNVNQTAPVTIAAGTKPGRSSDAGAVELAQRAGVTCVINLSNIARVYAEDPKINPEARAYDDLTWDAYLSMIPSAWDPGLSTPFDPVASKMAQVANLTVAIIDGHDTQAFVDFVRGGALRGTLIHP